MCYRRAPAGGGMSIVVAVRAMSAVMRRAAARGAVPCRISPAVSYFILRNTVFLLIVPLLVSGVQHAVLSSRAVFACTVAVSFQSGNTGYRVPRFASSYLIASSCLVSSRFTFRFASSLRLTSTRLAIRFARYGKREGVLFDYSYA